MKREENKKHIYFFIGTTAEYIKLAPLIKELGDRNIEYKIITSGQNRINFKDLEDFTGHVHSDINFDPKPKKSSLFFFILWALRTFVGGIFKLRSEFAGKKNGNIYFIIHGDTVTSLIGAFLAKIHRIKLVHIESGLRSFNFLEPIPEEINRFIIIHLADILFAPNEWALGNLSKVPGDKINTFENTLSEVSLWASNLTKDEDFIEKFGKYYIFFIHRQEHIFWKKEWVRKTMDLIFKNADEELNCVFVMHALTSRILETERVNDIEEIRKRLFIIPKQSFVDYTQLMNSAEFIATDSCTNQEEAYYMGLPFLALRNRTERVEGLNENVVISKQNSRITKKFLNNYKKYRRKKIELEKRPSKIVVDYLNSL